MCSNRVNVCCIRITVIDPNNYLSEKNSRVTEYPLNDVKHSAIIIKMLLQLCSI